MLFAGLLSLNGYSQVPVLSSSDTEKEATCRISGMVVKLADGAPLKGATVRVENGEDREHTIAAKTTADGRFELRNIPAGRYKDLLFRLIPAAVIAGRVFDADGEVPNAMVRRLVKRTTRADGL
jgi:Carboxypeptidase regulatory-like domain